ncbi:MAG: hypothetical protein OHK0046_07470 [Anaerolineae bacterium]
MDMQFFDNDQVPQPRNQIRIEALNVIPYPDRRRVFVEIKVTPFQERPNLLITAHDSQDALVAELNVIETMHANMEFTIHLRGKSDPAGVYSLTAELFYETRNPPQDRAVEGFTIPEESE